MPNLTPGEVRIAREAYIRACIEHEDCDCDLCRRKWEAEATLLYPLPPAKVYRCRKCQWTGGAEDILFGSKGQSLAHAKHIPGTCGLACFGPVEEVDG